MGQTKEPCKITNLFEELDAIRLQRDRELKDAEKHDYVNGYHHCLVQENYKIKKILDKYRVEMV